MPKIKVTNPKYVIDAHLKTNYFKLKNTGGPKGDKGDKGDTGATGATGRAATVAIGTTQTLNPGQSAFVNNVGTNNDAIFNFGIPQGPTGATGATGPQGPVGSVKSTVVSELPESGNGDTFYLVDREATTGTASGTHISFNNPEPDGEISDYDINGGTEQTTYTGKNLLNVEKTTQTVSGVTFTINADKTIIANGTASALITFNLINTTFTLASGQYYLSGCPSGGSDSTYRLDINNGADGNQRDYGNGSTFTLSQSTTINNVRIRIASGATLNRLEFKPMINTGSTAQPYEPYVGGIPAPNPQFPQPIETVTGRQTVTVTGKNLFNKNDVVTGAILVNGNIDATYTDNRTSNFIPVMPNTTYRVSGRTAWGVEGTYTQDKTWISRLAGDIFTTQANCYWVRVVCMLADLNNIQLEQGSTATTFEPYEGQDYEINLGKNLWGGFANGFTKSLGGITFVTKTDGTITNTAGTTSATACSAFASDATNNGFTKTLEAGVYCLSGASGDITLDVCDTSGTTLVTDSGNGATLTLSTEKTVFVRIRVASGKTLTAGTTKPQLEKGYIASSYSAYFEPIELCKIGNYQDRIYKENGKWWLEKQTGKVVLNGSEDWHKSSNTQVDRYWYNIYSGEVVPSFHQIYSDKFFYEYNVPTVNAMWVDVYQTLERLFVNYAPYGTTTVTDLKTWLASNNVTVYYPLATPTTTEITNAALIAQLEALLNATLYTGQNNISVGSADLAGPLDITYALFDKTNRHKVYIWSDSDNTWQIIVP